MSRLHLSVLMLLIAPLGCGGDGPTRYEISGTVTYDFVPVSGGRLDYGQTESRPARHVTVQFVAGGSVLASATADGNGGYSLEVATHRTGFLRARAESRQTGEPGWWFRVVDNTDIDALYTLDGSSFSTGTSDSRRDLHAGSGWTGQSYSMPRAAAPFAILDTIILGADFVAEADPSIVFPQLDIHWSENNVPTEDEDGNPDPTTGEIGSSQYVPVDGLYLLGAEDNDTEEYDRHVILHEFGHYLEFTYGRVSTIGGPHAIGDHLDLRVAFSEGLATALAAIMLDDPIYRDTGGMRQGGSFGFNVEFTGVPTSGWYSEASILELIYDLVDTSSDGNDTLAYPFSTIWSAITGPVTTTRSVVSIFPFLNAVRTANPADTFALDALAADQQIGPVTDDFGSNETNDAGSGDVLPIYTELTVGGPAVNICSTDEFRSAKLSIDRLPEVSPPAMHDALFAAAASAKSSGARGNHARTGGPTGRAPGPWDTIGRWRIGE